MTTNLGMHGLDNRADRWFAARPDGSSPVHFGGAYDNAFVRQVHGLEPYSAAAGSALEAILEDARADLRNGFIGLHMQPEYTPGTTAQDLLAHAAVAAEHDVPLCVHARYSDNLPPGTNLEAMRELVGAARETGAHIHVEHINSTGGTGVMAEALGRISDSILERSLNNHPRSTGCFSRVLGRYVRERGVLDLPTALAKMTIQPARLLERRCPGLRSKGRLGIGADADITVFDPATVTDRSTIENPAQESEGIRWVVVDGRVVRSPDGFTDQVPLGRGLRSDIGAV